MSNKIETLFKNLVSYKTQNKNTICTFANPCKKESFDMTFKTSDLPLSSIEKWMQGEDIETAMPNLTRAEQTVFVTGIKVQDQDDMFTPW